MNAARVFETGTDTSYCDEQFRFCTCGSKYFKPYLSVHVHEVLLNLNQSIRFLQHTIWNSDFSNFMEKSYALKKLQLIFAQPMLDTPSGRPECNAQRV
jgi:hypothetical protein